jgi:hypothetical protein
LHAIDCQNLFCEIDKYARVAFRDLPGNRIRIKTRFAPHADAIRYFYPPKWGLGDAVALEPASPGYPLISVTG